MRIRILSAIFAPLALIALSGCGGGGGGGGTAPAPVATTISGVASKGPFISGSPVKVFAIDPVTGTKSTQLGTGVVLDSQGNYSVEIGTYTGPVLIEVSGSYKDEANPAVAGQVSAATPLRAVISNAAAGNNPVMVTPLTDLAVREMNNVLVKANIDAKNSEIAGIFKLGSIVSTKPADASDAASATAGESERNYALALAAISQLVQNSGQQLDDVLKGMSDDISGNIMADRSIADYKTALFDFMTGANNKTGIADTATSTVNIGTFRIAHLTISAQGLPAGKRIGGMDFTFNLPNGVTLSKEAGTSQVSPGIVVVSGGAVGSTSVSLSTLNLQALRTLMASSAGFLDGEFVDISCTVPAGVTITASDFSAAIAAAVPVVTDLTGATISGVTLSASVDLF